MAWAGDDLWFVNTRFSCLCTRSAAYSFAPRWKPAFVSALAPEDRCHLNGLGLRDGRPRYVTALGRGDGPASWREHKRTGGVVMDVPANEIVTGGLSMPHSPRWHAGRLWVLESGTGRVGVVDPADGRFETVARLPGFTRGLDFAGPFAFVGLSQVRESAFFGGLPLTEGPGERACGVWVLHAATGRTAAFLKFEDGVQEIFAVQVLPGVRFPELIHSDPSVLADSFVLPDEARDVAPAAVHRREAVAC
jgi:uncharacterized protein (TIGR03032 family)